MCIIFSVYQIVYCLLFEKEKYVSLQDYVTVYDGYTTREPVILKFCGGGEPVPEAISSGPEILVEFTTSPYGTFLHPTPPHSLHGFQLEVQVRDYTLCKVHNYYHTTYLSFLIILFCIIVKYFRKIKKIISDKRINFR